MPTGEPAHPARYLLEREWGNLQVFADATSKVELKETYTFTSSATGKSFEGRSSAQLTNNTVRSRRHPIRTERAQGDSHVRAPSGS
jgi:hypothetical protein